MGQRYWVIGGHFAECGEQLEPGTEVIHGPYGDELHARMEWQRLTFKDRHEATERYSICVEPVLQ
jgi:hypothetical protein